MVFRSSHLESNAAHSKETDNATKSAVSTNIPAPLDRFRGKKGYLSVSNLVAQFWCEQQMEYNFLIPEQKPDTEEVQIGRSIHLARGTYATKLFNQSQGLQFKVNNGELVPFVQREINKKCKKIISIYKAMIQFSKSYDINILCKVIGNRQLIYRKKYVLPCVLTCEH